MANASYYRAKAQRCRELAAHSVQGALMAERWRTIAAEYDTLAEALEALFRWPGTASAATADTAAAAKVH
jgi:hypothetical protein